MKIVLEPWAIMPTRAHEFDAGLDLYSADDDVYIYPRSSELFDTGVHIQLPKNTVGFLKSKSGLNVKYGITSEGVIDVGYTGSIMSSSTTTRTSHIECGRAIRSLSL